MTHQLQIFHSIVGLIAIQMMDNFTRFKFPTEIFLHHNAVLQKTLTFHSQNRISMVML